MVNGRKRYLVISDTHIPFQLEDLDEHIQMYRGVVDGLIIAGDFHDEYAVSSFAKNKEISLQQELVLGYNHLEKWSKWFSTIEIFPGNHDERLDTHLAKSVATTSLFLFGQNIMLRKYIEGFVAKDIDGEIREYQPIPNLKLYESWFFQKGDAIIAHPKNFSKVPGKVVTMADEYFTQQEFDFRAVLIGHTHKAIKIVKSGKLLIELGCCCKEQEYAKGGRLSYTPQVNAVGLLVQKDGVTDFNETKFIIL